MFDGHRLYKIGDEWVFDLTEFIGYKVIQNGDRVESFERAYTVKKNKDRKDYEFKKLLTVPVGVMRKTTTIIKDYLSEALIDV